nr:tetratricopeptide repeat protein [Candidatus Calescibacterium sp.]
MDNILIVLQNERLFLIDLDGGVVTATQKVTNTVKHQCDTIAPEVYKQLIISRGTGQQVTIDRLAEYWSVAAMIHCLLFGVNPFFFIERFQDIEAYLQHYTWPQFHGLQNIQTCNDAYFGEYEKVYQSLPPSIRECLRYAFQNGYFQRDQRPTPRQWYTNLKKALTQLFPPLPPPPPPRLEVIGPKHFTFDLEMGAQASGSFTVRNSGGQNLQVTITLPLSLPFKIDLTETAFPLAPKEEKTVVIRTRRCRLKPGHYSATFTISSNGGQETVAFEVSLKSRKKRMLLFFLPVLCAFLLFYGISSYKTKECPRLVEHSINLVNQQQYTEAIASLTRALKLRCTPHLFHILYYRGTAFYYLGEYEKAYQDFAEAVKANPQSPRAHYARGLCAALIGKCNAARRDYEFLTELGTHESLQLAEDLEGEITKHCNTWR